MRDTILMFIISMFVFMLGVSIGKYDANIMQQKAIEIGCAEYNTTTGKFEWVRSKR